METGTELQVGTQMLIQEFAEIISSLKPNPTCKVCKNLGNRGWIGAGIRPDGTKYIQICCGQLGETEYVRLKNRITDVQLQLLQLEKHISNHAETIVQIISEQFWWNKVKRFFSRTQKSETRKD